MKTGRRFAALILAAVLMCTAAAAETKKAPEDFVFVGDVCFGELFDDVLEKLNSHEVSCLDLREEYGDTDEAALLQSYGITNINRIRFADVTVGGFLMRGDFYFDSENRLAFVRYAAESEDDEGTADPEEDYRQIEEQLNGIYGGTEMTNETGKQSGIAPSLWPQDYTDEGVSIRKEIRQYSERFAETTENRILIQHLLYTVTEDDNPDTAADCHEVCYTCVPKAESTWGF